MFNKYLLSFLVFFLLNLAAASSKAAPFSDSTTLLRDTGRLSISMEFQGINERLNLLDRLSRQGGDTVIIHKQIKDLEFRLNYILESLNHSKEHYRYRLLKQNSVYLSQLKTRTDQVANHIKKQQVDILNITREVDQRFALTESQFHRQDENVKRIYKDAFHRLELKWHRIDSANYKNILLLNLIESRVAAMEIIITDLRDEVAEGIRNFNVTLLIKSEPPLFQSKFENYSINFFENIFMSLEVSGDVLVYYLRLHWFSVLSSLFICIIICLWLVFLARRNKQLTDDIGESKFALKMALTQPYVAGILVAISFAIFMFPNPPIVLTEMLWTIQGALLIYLLLKTKEIPRITKFNWTVFVILFRSVAVFNLFLHVTYFDRWLILTMGLACMVIGVIFFMNAKRIVWPERRHKFRIAATLFILAELFSIVFNITGHFRLSVLLANTGVITMYTAVILVMFYDITTAAIAYQFEFVKSSNEKAVASDQDNFSNQLKRYVGIFSMFAWLMIFLSITNLYDLLSYNFREFIEKPIVIGDFTFTLSGVLIFCIIIWLSVFLSRFTSYISAKGINETRGGWKNNSLLLFKLGVITGGVLLAFVASGIPLDRLAIVLGALGVGIGFGLQGLVNNLISGVMVILEKPVKVGDFIEVESHCGTVTDIGIRASRIHTRNGIDVIIPNGELLSKHIVNWTLGSPYRNSSFSIIVDACSDLKMAKEMMHTCLEADPFVLKNPVPYVKITGLLEDAVEYQCSFWSSYVEVDMIKSRVLENLQQHFSASGIRLKNKILNLSLNK